MALGTLLIRKREQSEEREGVGRLVLQREREGVGWLVLQREREGVGWLVLQRVGTNV